MSLRKAEIVSAFFGLDNDMPLKSIGIWKNAPGKDGMPVVFSNEINPSTLDASDFLVTTQNGEKLHVDFATFRPAIEEFELRTILLIGEFGNAPDNEPVELEIVDDLQSRDGQNLKGQKIKVTPLEDGPFLSYAEYFTFDSNYPYVESGRGCDCPKSETKLIVRTVWSGGVRAVTGEELGSNELNNFTVKLLSGSDTLEVHPFQIADLDDNDNNIDLCINCEGIPFLVSVKENTAIDPRDDKNLYTQLNIVSRW